MTSLQFLPAKDNLRRSRLFQNTRLVNEHNARSILILRTLLNWRNLAGHLSRFFIQIAGKRLPTLVKKPAIEQEYPSPPGVPAHSFNTGGPALIKMAYGDSIRLLIGVAPE